MGRPKRVYPNSLPKFTKQITRKVKMMSGVHLTALHFLKETAQYFISIDSWAFCCSKFKQLKYGLELKVDIPILTDEKALSILDKFAWHHWVEKELKDRDSSQMKETIELLDRLYPNKKKIYFYEFKHLISSFCHGDFVSYDENGNEIEVRKGRMERRQYYNKKYCGEKYREMIPKNYPKEIQKLYKAYQKTDNDKPESQEAYNKYADATSEYDYENHNVIKDLISICSSVVVCPYIFSSPTVKGSSYEHAGEVYFVVTPDAVYFETDRHF